MKQKNIVVYTIPTCPDCHEAKRYFQENGSSFLEKDCTTNPDYPQEVYNLAGKQVVPTILIDDQAFIGFSNNYEAISSKIES
ncbi:glutaredoxin family protein [Shimazuella alba]|uniref:Glutaredoxin family protein n=1 Tax=Shimazuella alba TaxID=2690964 RepID=A0A6I4VLY2_9BACL|nr:glutaredoxin family protein [Shimazuella alba]MXQ52629.1 glutaredoxin family protein [Shimazuella alba]